VARHVRLDDVSVLDDGEVRERMDEALHRFIPEGALGGRLYNTWLDVFTPFMTAVAAVLGFLAVRKGVSGTPFGSGFQHCCGLQLAHTK
jgi:hypothetical protein